MMASQPDLSNINPYERHAKWVMILGGIFYVLALTSFVWAEYQNQAFRVLAAENWNKNLKACVTNHPQQINKQFVDQCFLDSDLEKIKNTSAFNKSIKLYFFTLPMLFVSLSTITGYMGLIWWGIYQGAARRPFVAVSAIGILIQTILLVWLIVVRSMDLAV